MSIKRGKLEFQNVLSMTTKCRYDEWGERVGILKLFILNNDLFVTGPVILRWNEIEDEEGNRTFISSEADAIINPKQEECKYKFKQLCGAGVAFKLVEILYEDVPDTLSQLIRTAFIPSKGHKFIVSDFSAIEARVIAWFAGESWRQQVFEKGGDIYCASASQMFKVPVEKHGINGHLRQKGKIAELALGYGGSVGALKAMGALDMGLSEDELPALVDAWRQANPRIVEFWWAVDRAVMEAVKYKHTTTDYGLTFSCKSGMLFITLPSGRKLAYVKPKIGTNKFGGSCITYEGVGGTKKWERLDSYGPKFVENIVQATARDILCYAMKTLRCCSIVMHIHDELVIEADPKVSLDAICEQMGRTPPWAKGLLLRADGYTTPFYKKD